MKDKFEIVGKPIVIGEFIDHGHEFPKGQIVDKQSFDPPIQLKSNESLNVKIEAGKFTFVKVENV